MCVVSSHPVCGHCCDGLKDLIQVRSIIPILQVGRLRLCEPRTCRLAHGPVLSPFKGSLMGAGCLKSDLFQEGGVSCIASWERKVLLAESGPAALMGRCHPLLGTLSPACKQLRQVQV